MTLETSDTIVAQATASGRGGVGIIRISGKLASDIAKTIMGKLPKPRMAAFTHFLDETNRLIDEGIALYFPAPHSYTGEDVIELQGHGGPVVLDMLLRRVISLGARLAEPGEFTARAFLNDKLDLTQAEAIADLIDAQSQTAVRSALRSLQGKFSDLIHQLLKNLIDLRLHVEAALDFPEEEIDFLADEKIVGELDVLLNELDQILASAKQGRLLRDGMTLVIAGKPNVGKSSLLNRLSGEERAIVTDIPGTTRDILRETILLDGLPIHIVDTAGLRESTDIVEQEGIRRAWKEIEKADRILLITDVTQPNHHLFPLLPQHLLTVVHNKIDLTSQPPQLSTAHNYPEIFLSAKTGVGVDLLINHLKTHMGYETNVENVFTARERHLRALHRAKEHIFKAKEQWIANHAAELLAEELLQAQNFLNQITGEFRPDDLLGKIFANFCIGK